MRESAWDVIVIGGGAAGLVAAARAAERGRRTLLVEKNRKPGVKILMSGGTRCNVTHDTDVTGMVRAFGRMGNFLRPAFYGFPPQAVVEMLVQEGVATKIEPTGKVFPVSDRAFDVQQALVRRLQRSSCAVRFGCPVHQLSQHEGLFELRGENLAELAQRVVLTTGGCSYPGCGTTGEGYAWLEQLGHTLVPPRPALVPLVCSEAWLRSLSGITLPDVTVRVVAKAELPAATDPMGRFHAARHRAVTMGRGSLLFTHFGLSGPVVLDVSRAVTAAPRLSDLCLSVDFLPDETWEATLARWMGAAARSGPVSVARALSELIPQRFATSLMQRLSIERDRPCAELAKATAIALTRALRALEIEIEGTRGFAKAEVTAGGADLREVDPRTMHSRCTSGLYIAGEILDVDGPIGGYNFQAAFSTGWLAGDKV